MNLHGDSDCTDTLLDLVCYEVINKRLSPEMEDILERHLRCCKVVGLRKALHMPRVCRNWG